MWPNVEVFFQVKRNYAYYDKLSKVCDSKKRGWNNFCFPNQYVDKYWTSYKTFLKTFWAELFFTMKIWSSWKTSKNKCFGTSFSKSKPCMMLKKKIQYTK